MTETPIQSPPAVNPALIRQYLDQFTSGDERGFNNLVTLFDHLRKSELRACELSRAYLAQIDRMHREGYTTRPNYSMGVLNDSRQGETAPEGSRQINPSQTQSAPTQRPTVAKSPTKTPRAEREKLQLDL